MNLDPFSLQYAQKLLNKGYGFQNASRIANVNENDLRDVAGAAHARPVVRPCPSPWLEPRVRIDQNPSHTRAQQAMALSGPSRAIIHAVADKYGMTTADLIGPKRSRWFSFARHEAMYRVRLERRLSLPAIGRIFGGRDHTSVLHALRCHEARAAWGEFLIAAGNADEYQPDLFARAA